MQDELQQRLYRGGRVNLLLIWDDNNQAVLGMDGSAFRMLMDRGAPKSINLVIMANSDEPVIETTFHAMVPSIVVVKDYHDFEEVKTTMKQLGIQVKVKELGMSVGRYVGLVYTGEKPDQTTITALLAEKNITLLRTDE